MIFFLLLLLTLNHSVYSVSHSRVSNGGPFGNFQRECRVYQQQDESLEKAIQNSARIAQFIGQFFQATAGGQLSEMSDLCQQDSQLCDQLRLDDIISRFKNVHKTKGGSQFVLDKYKDEHGEIRDFHLFNALDTKESNPPDINHERVENSLRSLREYHANQDLTPLIRKYVQLCDDFIWRTYGFHVDLFDYMLSGSKSFTWTWLRGEFLSKLESLDQVLTNQESHPSSGVQLYKRNANEPPVLPFKVLKAALIRIASVVASPFVFIAAVFSFIFGLVFFKIVPLLFCGSLYGGSVASQCCVNGIFCVPEVCCSTACCRVATCDSGSDIVSRIKEALLGCLRGCDQVSWEAIANLPNFWATFSADLVQLAVKLYAGIPLNQEIE
ncbi:hypothetical protein MP228_011527 [Amoeboaphelidium protococcarum]|nr:hypothetical protein MP228_011527 [Amoeboaphelidium protococcarum]